MKEIKRIIAAYHHFKAIHLSMVMATVVRISGSSYRRPGARMLIAEDGTWVGGVSGGCLEGDLLKKAKQVMLSGAGKVVVYDTTEDDPYQIGVGLGCQGVIEILLAPLTTTQENCHPIFSLEQLISQRVEQVLVTVVSSTSSKSLAVGDCFLWKEDLAELGKELSTEVEQVLTHKKSIFHSYSISPITQVEVFIEYLPPSIQLIIFGGEYDIYPLLEMTQTMGWDIRVVANPLRIKKELVNSQRVISNKTAYWEQLEIDNRSALLIMAHDYQKDFDCLKIYAQSNIPYIGLLGPKKRGSRLFTDLESEGIKLTQAQRHRIFNPIGLDIGANTPEEVALSIVSEVQAFFAKRAGGFLKLRIGTIHE